ncbi:hypothetical protein ABG768_020312 [Culter alburnus]|uniref:THAP-type domain-containing protein n=1 Tax=Culter alburnus TaxID=194366 RepID=A0AAW2AYG1_CULAL
MVCSKHFHKGKPAYEMLECDPDWAPSLYLGHTEVKVTNTDRFKRFSRRATRSQQQQQQHPSLGTDNTGPEADFFILLLSDTTPATEMEGPVNPPPSPGTVHTGHKTELNEAAHLFPDYSAPVAEMEGPETQPLPSAPDNAGREEEMETETSGDDGAPMGNAEEQQNCTMCGLRLNEIIRLQEENRKLKGELSKKALDEKFLKDNDSKVKYYTGLPSFSLLMGVLMQIIPSLPKSETKERKLSHFQIALLFDISRQTASNLFTETINVLHAHLSPLVHWHQSASDKQINCGFFQKLSPGDLVLADHGFDVKENVALVGATLKIPAFTRGHCQLNVKDVEETRKLAHVRIHVERVIGCALSLTY